MGRISATTRRLMDAGFTDITPIREGRWWTATTPLGDPCAVLRQSDAAWHTFGKAEAWTASDSGPGKCHLNGLGDAVATDREIATYTAIIRQAPRELSGYRGLSEAVSQVS